MRLQREPIARFDGRAAVLPIDDVDTDQIIPARFLKTTTRTGLGAHLFAGWRYGDDGSPRREFPLNSPAAAGASILVAGRNFGCGSSREHAPWALVDYGFGAIIALSFADIFRQNALKNGLLPIVVDEQTQAAAREQIAQDPDARLTVDLERQVLTLPDGREVAFSIDPFGRECLLGGVDEIGYVLRQEAAIAEYERRQA